ncbi:hypothetical protein [Jiella marina]|uniref:hypothetical protein n=1 Tax=Jiella sp. LLJ827 TaxID=2917712 RepID=UPI002101B1E4|nr:hypothetical protein [Jiella sp. LLJ827]MCQ0989211.1 hypothetical protein [Jiella sp. LLJ827]
MAIPVEDTKKKRYQEARESFSGRLLTDTQFDEAVAITGIIEREIHRTGSFKEKLGDYSYAFARSERFDAMKAETIIRDLFKERYGRTMNALREGLIEREDALGEDDIARGHEMALSIGEMVEKGDKLTFNRALAHKSGEFAKQLGITHTVARNIMAEQFEAVEGQSIYDWGKQLDENNYRAQVEAEKEGRSRSNGRSPYRSSYRSAASRSSRDRTGPAGP